MTTGVELQTFEEPWVECGDGACAAGACSRHRRHSEVEILREQYDRRVAMHIQAWRSALADNRRLRALLEEALGWLSDPSQYHGTEAGKLFEAEAMAALAPMAPPNEGGEP